MAAPVDLRCPHCGARLTAYTGYPAITSYTRCPHCGTVLPFVGPREPAPLYSWEVYPGLYPPTSLPTSPSPHRIPALVALLLAATLVLAGLGGVYAWLGGDALEPGSLTIAGTISPGAVNGTWVLVQGENGFAVNVSAPAGVFSVPHVPFGGVVITVGADGYAASQLDIFVSPVYSSITGSPQELSLTLGPADTTGTAVVDTTAFPNLESFVATVWSGTGLLWIAALFTGIGVFAARRDQAPYVVIGGATAIVAPFVVPLLGIDVVNEWLTAIGLLAIPVGIVVLVMALPPFARAQPPVEPI